MSKQNSPSKCKWWLLLQGFSAIVLKHLGFQLIFTNIYKQLEDEGGKAFDKFDKKILKKIKRNKNKPPEKMHASLFPFGTSATYFACSRRQGRCFSKSG